MAFLKLKQSLTKKGRRSHNGLDESGDPVALRELKEIRENNRYIQYEGCSTYIQEIPLLHFNFADSPGHFNERYREPS